MVATFAGGFTYGNVISLQTSPSTCHAEEFDDIRTLLSVAFILFTASLFVTIVIPIILRGYDPNVRLPGAVDRWTPPRFGVVLLWEPHFWVQVIFFCSAVLLVAGFVLLHIVLIDSGQTAVGGVGIALVGIAGTCAVGFGLFT